MTPDEVKALHARLAEIETERDALSSERASIKRRLLVANTAVLQRLETRVAEQERRERALAESARVNLGAMAARERNADPNPPHFQERD